MAEGGLVAVGLVQRAHSKTHFHSMVCTQGDSKNSDEASSLGVVQSTSCLLCGDPEETTSHLFGGCIFGVQIWSHLLHLLGYSRNPQDWVNEINWCQVHFVGDLGNIKKLIFCAFIYHIWWERNKRVHGDVPAQWETMLFRILQDVRVKTSSLQLSFKDNSKNHQVVGDLQGDIGWFERR